MGMYYDAEDHMLGTTEGFGMDVDRLVTVSELCDRCEHLDLSHYPLTCTAFPDGIPEDILAGDVDHQKPVDGDGGITFKLRAGADPPRRKGTA